MSNLSKALPPLPLFSHVDESFDPKPAAEDYELTNTTSFGSLTTITKDGSRPSSGVPLLRSPDRHDSTAEGGGDTKKSTHFHGWRMSVCICAGIAGAVLLINSILTLWASIRYGNEGGFATLQEGSCKKTKTLSLWLHLAINVLSTLLLSASNYSMQCLASPTRKEVDKAHRRQIWLDIGVPSVRNLRHISWYRITLWSFLALSGVPLHLLYNSAVFSTLAATEYSVFAGSSDLVTNIALDWSAPIAGETDRTLQDLRTASKWERLENKECISAYGQPFVSSHGDLLAITDTLNRSLPAFLVTATVPYGSGGLPYDWICETTQAVNCDINQVLAKASSWTLLNGTSTTGFWYGNAWSPPSLVFSIQYCLSQPMEERCRVQLSLVVMCIVIGCNLVKMTCMVLTLWYHRSQPLVTLGDAISSFLQDVDPTTQNMCVAGKKKFIQKDWKEGAETWQTQKHRWFSAASWKRWLICNLLCVATLITAVCLLTMGLPQLTSRTLSHIWKIGYGTVTSESMVTWNLTGSSGLLLTTLIANFPQALLSFLFLTYNSLFTCMLLAAEWADFAHDRKPLRVTSPVGLQRSTYRLQLPYRYGIPLLITSGALHWLVSQSLFLARVTAFTTDGREDAFGSISTIGYSCIAIITVIILGTVIVLLGIANGCRRYREGMPLVGSCSAAISAACQCPELDEDAPRRAVLWGANGEKKVVVDVGGRVMGVGEGLVVGHCCFSSWEVERPVVGELYMGDGGDVRSRATAGVRKGDR